jgi:repressor LexA
VGLMPSTREIQEHFGFASQTAAMGHLRALERKGVISRLVGKARAVVLRPTADESSAASAQDDPWLRVPIFGAIPAGMPSPDDPLAEGSLRIDAANFGLSLKKSYFALRVRGESMINAHICPGDFVILDQITPREGDIVAALIDGETTLKRYMLKNKKPVLQAENDAYPDLIPARDLQVQGVMVGLVRQYRPRAA